MHDADSSNTDHPRSDEVRGRERQPEDYAESGGFGDRGYGDRGDFGDQGAGAGREERRAVPEDGTPERSTPPEG